MRNSVRYLLLFLAGALLCLAVGIPSLPDNGVGTREAETQPPSSITVSIALWGLQDPGMNENSRLVAEELQRRFGITIESYPIEKNNWQQRIDLAVASNSLPDVFVYIPWMRKAENLRLIESRRIRSIPQELYGGFPNLSRLIESRKREQAFWDGEIYHIPRPILADEEGSGNRYAFYYRKDYAESLGFDFSESVDWETLGRFFLSATEKDPDGNGLQDTTGFTILSGGQELLFDTLYENYGIREWVYEDGGWIPGLLSSRCRELTRWLKGLYERGAVDREYFSITPKASSEKFAMGRSAALLAPADRYSAADDFRIKYWEVLHPSLPIEQYVDLMPCPIAPDSRQYNKPQADDSATLFSANVDDAKLARVLAMMEFLYTEQGNILLRYGFEGTHYQGEDGRIRSLVKDMNGQSILFSETCPDISSLKNLSTWRVDGYQSVEEESYLPWDYHIDERLHRLYWTHNSLPMWTATLTDKAVIDFSIRDYAEQNLPLLIVQPKNLKLRRLFCMPGPAATLALPGSGGPSRIPLFDRLQAGA